MKKTLSKAPVAIVTGAGGGIGQTIARRLAKEKWFVVVNDINEVDANKTLEAITHCGHTAMVHTGDVGNADDVASLFSAVAENNNRTPKLLINNAAVQTWASLDELAVEDWQRTINTNLTGCFTMTKYFAKSAPQGSSIINIGSGCNHLAFPTLIDYSASKGGIEMLTKSSALELGPRGIRVNCIAPGAIATDRTAQETDSYSDTWSALTPLRRIGTPDDVANAVLLLIDDKASFITGQTINVDGGLFSRAIWPADY